MKFQIQKIRWMKRLLISLIVNLEVCRIIDCIEHSDGVRLDKTNRREEKRIKETMWLGVILL
jgi:hypothetical protein